METNTKARRAKRAMMAGLMAVAIAPAGGCAQLMRVSAPPAVATVATVQPPRWAPVPGRHPGLYACMDQASEDCYGRFTSDEQLVACLEEEVEGCRREGGVFVASFDAGRAASVDRR